MLEYTDSDETPFQDAEAAWKELLPETPLEPHTRHKWYEFDSHAATHVRLNIYPDGGVARLRLFGIAEL